jgi:hypothetical protein
MIDALRRLLRPRTRGEAALIETGIDLPGADASDQLLTFGHAGGLIQARRL